MKNKTVYLDYAATTPVDKRVLEAMLPYFREKFYNPSSDYGPSREVSAAIAAARKTVAEAIGAKQTEIIFTAGGTEANNLAILGIVDRFPEGEIIYSAIEHESVLEPIKYLKNKGQKTLSVGVNKQGLVDPDKLADKITENTVLISIMYANNEVGTIQAISKIAQVVEAVRKDRQKRGNKTPLYLHTDACQATQYLDMHASRLGVDMMSINSGKIYGPKQIGALYVKAGTEIGPIIHGGGQESGMRSGTENVPAVVGFAEAIKLASSIKKDEVRRMKELQQEFCRQILSIKGARVNGSMKKRLPNNIHVTFPGIDNERLLMQLDELGIYASAGSACSAVKGQASHVLSAMGISDAEARSSVRFSLGRHTTTEDITRAIRAVSKLVV
jgi:cysteine desulfurase